VVAVLPMPLPDVKPPPPRDVKPPTPDVNAPPRDVKPPTPDVKPQRPSEDLRTLEQLEREWSGQRSLLSARDRRAALRALYARIDAAGGPADERARKKRAALAELIRQHAN
jgi:hypothetical protein